MRIHRNFRNIHGNTHVKKKLHRIMSNFGRLLLLSVCCLGLFLLSACGSGTNPGGAQQAFRTDTGDSSLQESISEDPVPSSGSADSKGSRDNTPQCLVPEASGTTTYENEVVMIDASHTDEGYLCVSYVGDCPKVKLQITGPSQVTYTYNLSGNGYETFPLTSGNGTYSVGVYENISGTQYATSFYQELTVDLADEFLPFLYPSQYVNFTPQSSSVLKAEELAAPANTDLDVVSNVYNYVVASISYDYEKASGIASGYLSNVDETLRTGSGICLDYAALVAAMLRSQGIPTHLEVGYAQEAYHAWISTYVDEKGWVNGIIEFDGTSWSLMDPTFAANSSEKSLKKFIGDGSNYTVKYVY